MAVGVLEAVHLHHQHVDERVEARSLVHRILHDDGFHARCRLDRLERRLEVGFVVVELVDDADDGFLENPGVARLDFAAYFPAVDGAVQEHAHVAYLERREEVAAEVVRARAVDDVELALHEFREKNRRVDRALVFVFDVRVVREGVVGFDAAPAVDDFAFVGHRFGQGGLARARGADQNDVLDLFGCIVFHVRYRF